MAKAAAAPGLPLGGPAPAPAPSPLTSTPVGKRKQPAQPSPASASQPAPPSNIEENASKKRRVRGRAASKQVGTESAQPSVSAAYNDNEVSRDQTVTANTTIPSAIVAEIPSGTGRKVRGKGAKTKAAQAQTQVQAKAASPDPASNAEPPKAATVAFANVKIRHGDAVHDNLHVPIHADSTLLWFQQYLIDETGLPPTTAFFYNYTDSSVSPPEHYTIVTENRFNSFKEWALHAPAGTKITVNAIIAEPVATTAEPMAQDFASQAAASAPSASSAPAVHANAAAPKPSSQEASATHSAPTSAKDPPSPATDSPSPPAASASSSSSRKNLGCGICSAPDTHPIQSCPWIIEGDFPKLQERFEALKELQQRKKGHERTAQKELKTWLKENKPKRKRAKKSAAATAAAAATDTESGADTPRDQETDVGEADADAEGDEDDDDNNDELAADASVSAAPQTPKGKADQTTTKNTGKGCLICSSAQSHTFQQCPWILTPNTNKVRARLVELKTISERDLKLEKKLGAWLKTQGVTVPRMRRKADSDTTATKDPDADTDADAEAEAEGEAEVDQVEDTDVDEDAEGEPDEDETDAAAAEAAAGSVSTTSVSKSAASTPTPAPASARPTEDPSSPRKSATPGFCAICSIEDPHELSDCPWIVQADVAKLRMRLGELKALQQRKKAPERAAQREVQEWLKSQGMRGSTRRSASTLAVDQSMSHQQEQEQEQPSSSPSRGGAPAAAAAAAAQSHGNGNGNGNGNGVATPTGSTTSTFSPYTKLSNLQPAIFRKGGMAGLIPDFGLGGGSGSSTQSSSSQQSMGLGGASGGGGSAVGLAGTPHRYSQGAAGGGPMPPGSVGFDGSVAHPKHLLSGLTNPIAAADSSSSSDDDSDESIEEDSSDDDDDDARAAAAGASAGAGVGRRVSFASNGYGTPKGASKGKVGTMTSHVPPEKRLSGSSTKKVKKPKSSLSGL
ncbi:unnamed protein product [Tilletia controversa]|nr:unnamed protein product [Tilletia controversa]